MSFSRKLFLALALAPALTTGATAQQPETIFTWSGRVASGSTFGIKHYNGAIEVRESTNDRVEFRAERSRRRSNEVSFQVENTASGTTICSVYQGRSVCDSGRRNWNWDGEGPPSSRLTVLLPKGVRLDATTGNGEVMVDKASNDVDITTGNGDVRILMTAGRVDVTTGNGELEVDGATGPVNATTGNGRVYVNTSSGPVTVTTGNGDIDARMKTLTGTSSMRFVTGNGTVVVAVPGNFNGEIDASTGHGDFRSDFEIRVFGRLNPRHIRGTIGEGGRTIRMQTGNGGLELRKIN
jgi:DUF4097 and DUF4098 domain-containing protein YvlB